MTDRSKMQKVFTPAPLITEQELVAALEAMRARQSDPICVDAVLAEESECEAEIDRTGEVPFGSGEQAERLSLRESDKAIQTILENITDAFLAFDTEWRFVYVNRQAERSMRKTRQELLGRCVWEVYPECIGTIFEREYRRALAENMPTRFETFYAPLGIWLEVHASPIPTGLSVCFRDVTAQKQEEAERLQLGHFLELLLESTGECIYGIDVQGCCTLINRAGAQMLGYIPEELVGQNFHAIAHHSRRDGSPYPEAECPIYQAISTGKACHAVEGIFWRRDGTALPVEFMAYPIRDGATIQGAVVTVRDITERKRAEDALKASEQRFREMAENMREVFWMSVPGFQEILYVSPAYETVWGRSCDSLYQQPLNWVEALHPDDQAHMLSLLEKQAASGYDAEYRIVRPDGSIRWIHDRGFPIRNEAGEIYRLAGIAEDITERKEAEAALRATEALNRAVLSSLSAHIAVLDRNGLIIATNDAWERFAQTHSAQPASNTGVGADYLEVCRRATGPASEEAPRVLKGLESVLCGAQHHFSLEYPCFSPTQRHWFLLSATRLQDERGGAVVSHTNITERKFMESQLAHAQKMESIGQLAAGIAHEINTPTQYIGDNVRFLKEAYEDLRQLLTRYEQLLNASRSQASLREAVVQVEEALLRHDAEYLLAEIPKAIEQSLDGIQRVTRIVQAMKEFSHPGTEEKVAVDINRAIESALTVARNEWKYVAEVVTDFDPTLPLVPCLPGDFNQVILNIVINAAHAIAEAATGEEDPSCKGLITVGTRREEDWVEVRITDSGPGIPEAIRSRIFDPFFTTKEVGKGTGQGLAIAHSIIVDKHQGTIHFETESGKGTTFVLRLSLGTQSLRERTTRG